MTNVVTELSADEVQSRLAGKTGAAYEAELRKIVADSGLKVENHSGEPEVNLTDVQFERLFSGILGETKKIVEETTANLQKKYDMSSGTARAASEEFLGKELAAHQRKTAENKIIAKRFAAIMKMQLGMMAGDEHKKALDEEASYLRKNYNREMNAMSLGTDSTGGFLAPELWETRLYQALLKTSYTRRYATLIDMTGVEILRMPRMTSGLSAYTRDEATAGTTSQPVFSQFTLQPKVLMVTSNPISLEMLEAAQPSVIDILTNDAVRAFGRKEDEAVFVGSDSQFTGLMESSTNTVTMATGKLSAVDTTFEDLFDLENQLGEQYTPDEDNQSSGGVAGQAMYFMNKSVVNALKKLKGNDNYYWSPVSEMVRDKQINGYPWKRVTDLPNTSNTASTKFMCFGNLRNVYVGYRPGIRTDLLKEGIVSGANLGTTAQYALRFIEFFDQNLIDTSAFSVLSTAAS